MTAAFTWNDFVQQIGRNNVTAILLALALFFALVLLILAWKFASDIRGENEDTQVDEAPQDAQEQERVESPAYILTEVVAEETLPVAETSVAARDVADSTAADTLRKGIAEILPDEDETGEMSVRYDRSFVAKLIQSDDLLKERYSEIKNYLLSFKKVHARMSWGRESFRIGRDCFARLVIKGKTLCLYLAIIPLSCQDTKYKTEEVDLAGLKDTPCMYRIKSDRRVTYAKELIDIILQEYDARPVKGREAVDYYMPYEGTVDLIKKGLVKRKVIAKRKDFLAQLKSLDGRDDVGVA